MNFSTSLICCNLLNISQDINTIIQYDKNFNWFHADFMDGNFVPRLGISPELIKFIKLKYNDNIIIDSHLMISDPYTYCDVIAPYSDIIFIHKESVTDPLRTIQKLRKNYSNVKIGMTYNVFSIPNEIELQFVDYIMFMGISPGVLGTGSFFESVCKKIEKIYNKKIFIDGSVNFKTIKVYNDLNVDTLVCGNSTIFNINEDNKNLSRKDLIKFNIDKIKKVIL